MTSTGDDADVAKLAAALRSDADDLSLYAGFLLNTLSQALPAELIDIDRERSMRDRMQGKEGRVTGVHVRLGDSLFSLRRARVGAPAAASVGHQVNGIVLATQVLSLDVWSTRLSRELLARATIDSAAASSLAELLHPRGLD